MNDLLARSLWVLPGVISLPEVGGVNLNWAEFSDRRAMADVPAVAGLQVKVGQEYRVKLGKSFTFPRDNAFHTVKCTRLLY